MLAKCSKNSVTSANLLKLFYDFLIQATTNRFFEKFKKT